MALFKIFKGNETAKLTDSNATGYRTPTDGYAYYDTSSKLFYIDAAYGSDANNITRAPINANIANTAMNGVYYGTCSTAQATKTKVATLVNSDGFKLATGVMVAIKFTYASAASTMTLNVNSTGAKNLVQYGTTAMSSTTSTNGWAANAVVPFVYDGTRWVRFYWSNSTYYYTSAYSDTAAGTAEKVGKSSAAQTLTGSRYFELQILNDNTVSGAITLNMNSLGAKAIYINGEPSSTTNHTLPKGCYLVYYDADGNNGNGCYHFRTDNQLSGNLAGNAATATYATTAGTANSVAWANVDGAPDEASTSAAGLMSTADKTKLNGIATGAEVNQNAFSNIKVGANTAAADAKTDTVEFVGSNIGIAVDTNNTTNDKITFSLDSTNVVTALGYTPGPEYSNAAQNAAGLMSASDKTKLDGIATGAEVNQNAFTKIKAGSNTATADSKTDIVEFVGSNIGIAVDTSNTTNDKITFSLSSANVIAALGYTPPTQDTTYEPATTSTAGLMSSDDKTKLNGIETGAQVNKLESVTASGTTPLTLSAGTITNKSIAISGSIADATTSAKGVVKIGDGISVTDGTISVTAANLGLSSAMLFKGSLGTNGTITNLPAASADNQGYTYKVITANTYTNTSGPAKVGDVFVSDGSQWVLIPSGDEPSGTVTSITLIAGTGISLDTDNTAITTSGSRTITNTGVTGVKGESESTYRTGQVNITRANLGLGNLATASSIANHSYTPAGSVTVTPTVTVNTTTVNSITAVGELPSLSMTVTNEVLSFTWAAGSLPTKGNDTTVATGIDTATATASFTGTAATLSHTVS